MAAPTIPNGEEHFFPIIYEGNGAGQRIGKFVPFTDNATIANSCIFNSPDSPVLSRTPSGTGTSKKTFTISAWVKRGKLINSASDHSMIIYGVNHGSSSRYSTFALYNGGSGNPTQFRVFLGKYTTGSSTTGYDWYTNRTLEDTSKWYHLMVAVDTTDSTASDRVKMYIDGERITSFASSSNPSLNDEFYFGSEHNNYVSTYDGSFGEFDGYIAEFNFVDGSALTPSTFGLTDTSTGRWIPKTLSGITYGTNGFRLKFQDSSALGDDTSGNTNDFTVSNIVAGDQTTDSPTQNHATLSSSRTRGTITLTEGNLKITSGAVSYANSATTLKFSETNSQGLYFEVKQVGSIQNGMSVLIMRDSVSVSGLGNNGQFTDCFGLQARGGGGGNTYWTSDNGSNGYDTSVSHAVNDYIQVAFKEGKVWFGINNTWIGSGNPATGANPTFNNIAGQDFRFLISAYQNNDLECNFGQKSFNYTPPTSFVAVQQDNLPSTAKGISDFLIIKNRDAADSWIWQDSLRGAGEYGSSSTATQYNTAIVDGVQKFLAGGFSTEDNDAINTSGESYVAYNFHLNGGTTTTDSSGTLSTELQANATAGFSVGKFTVSGSGNVTWAHGLGGVPEMGILCAYNSTNYGTTYHHKISTTPYSNGLFLINNDGAFTSSNIWGSAKPTSTLWTGLVGSLFSAGEPYIFYSFRGIEGFSKFGSYIGNGNADGPFVYTGFKPSFLIVRSIAATNWNMFDSARNTFNPVKLQLYADTTEVDYDLGARGFDFLSNGFKLRQETGYGSNNSGQDYIYMAFAEHPFVGDGTNPVTAR